MEDIYIKLLTGFVGTITFLIAFIFKSQDNRLKSLESDVKALEKGYITEQNVRIILDDKLNPMQETVDKTSTKVDKIFSKIEEIRIEAAKRSSQGKTYLQKNGGQ